MPASQLMAQNDRLSPARKRVRLQNTRAPSCASGVTGVEGLRLFFKNHHLCRQEQKARAGMNFEGDDFGKHCSILHESSTLSAAGCKTQVHCLSLVVGVAGMCAGQTSDLDVSRSSGLPEVRVVCAGCVRRIRLFLSSWCPPG